MSQEQLDQIKLTKECWDARKSVIEIWQKFEHEVKKFCKEELDKRDKNERRKAIDYSLFSPDEEFIKLANYIFKFSEEIPQTTPFFRARLVNHSAFNELHLAPPTKDKNGIYGFPACKMGIPPPENAGANRASSSGKPMLYLASKKERACMEVRPIYGSYISVMEYHLCRSIKVINLIRVSIKDYSIIEGIKIRWFMEYVLHAFSYPIAGADDIDYAPTQYLSYFIEKQRNEKIDGIKYGLTDDNDTAYCLALFSQEKLAIPDSDYGQILRCIEHKCTYVDYNSKEPNVNISSDLSWEKPVSPEKWQMHVNDFRNAIEEKG